MRKFLICIAAIVLSAAAAQADDPWADWGAAFTQAMTACVQAKAPNCLPKAFQSQARPAALGPYVDDDLTRDLRTAEVLLHDIDSSNAMYALYGIDTPDYLGTGYSVPLTAAGAPGSYTEATQSEYFVPNLCAQAVDPKVCPTADAQMWTWRLTDAQMSAWADKPIAKLLRGHWAKTGAKALAAAWKATAVPGRPDLPPLLIRFGNFPPAYYNGLIGKNGAQRVFFANFEQVRTKTLRAALTATGSASLLANPNPANTFFIWIYAPDAKSQAAVATWKALFKLLEQPVP